MNLKSLSDKILLDQTQQLVRREREVLNEILNHLREIERRRLFSQLGYKSLFDYATKKLGYADDQASRRIASMRLLRDLPEIEEKIVSGALTLTNLSMAQTMFRQEQKRGLDLKQTNSEDNGPVSKNGFTRMQKLDLLSQLENKSKREAEKIIISHSSAPAALFADRIRTVSANDIELKFVANANLREKLEIVKGLLAHSQPDVSLGAMMERLCDIAICHLDPAKKIKPKAREKTKPESPPAPDIKQRTNNSREHLPVQLRREIWRNANSKCQNCGSVHALQVDHIRPVAQGGSNEPANLRLLCRSCNQRAGINRLGIETMDRFIDKASDDQIF